MLPAITSGQATSELSDSLALLCNFMTAETQKSLVFAKDFLRDSRKSLSNHQETNHSQEGFPQWHHATTTSAANKQPRRFPNQKKATHPEISCQTQLEKQSTWKAYDLHSLAENWWIDLYAAKDGQVSACDLPPMEKDIIAYRTVLNCTVWCKQGRRWVGQNPSWDVCKPGGQLQERSDLCDCQQGFCHQVLNHVLWRG